MRVDKWLWAIRVYKTRAQAAAACQADRVARDGVHLKAGARLKVGDRLTVTRDGLVRELQVVELIEKRVGAERAAEAARELTPEERVQEWLEAKRQRRAHAARDRGAGRPSKRDRRLIDQIKGEMGWE